MDPNDQSYWQDITVVIVVFNSSHVIAHSLKSVEHAAEVILVDNASTDRTVEIARETLPTVRVIQNPINMGYGTRPGTA
jgi:glycosyltransferase involved in cell wall biosynthesis